MLQPDGKVIVSDYLFPSFGTIRVNTDGSLDETFGDNGKIVTTIHDASIPQATFLEPGGKISIAGISLGQGTYFSSVRYLANGTIDTTYGLDGISSTELPTDYRQVTSIALQPDGKLLAALSKSNNETGTYDFKIRRFNTDNTYDDSFGGQEGITTSFYSGYDEAFSVALQSDNKIVVAGATHNGINEEFAMARYTNTVLAVNQYTNDVSTITIYPNPVKDILHISTAAGSDVIDYIIYNMIGQVIFRSSGNDLDINTTSFSKGIYNIMIKTTKGTVIKRIIME